MNVYYNIVDHHSSYINSYKSRVSPSYLLVNFTNSQYTTYPLLQIGNQKLPIQEFTLTIINENGEESTFVKPIVVVLKLS